MGQQGGRRAGFEHVRRGVDGLCEQVRRREGRRLVLAQLSPRRIAEGSKGRPGDGLCRLQFGVPGAHPKEVASVGTGTPGV